MRKTVALLLVLCLALAMCACGGEPVSDETLNTTEEITTGEAELNVPIEEDTQPDNAEPTHVHQFEAEDCLTTRVCACGETEEPWGHNFMGGTCSNCGEPDPDYTGEKMAWIPTRGGTKYHTYAFCSGMEESTQITQAEAVEQGYEECKRCH